MLISFAGKSIKRIIVTRWSPRREAVSFVKTYFSEIITALEKLTGEKENTSIRTDARKRGP